MRALTVRQPWATAITYWGKNPENRNRNIAGSYRGSLAIHAGLREDEAAYDDEMIRDALGRYDDGWELEDLLEPRGAIIGVVNLWAVHQARPGCCPNRGVSPFGSGWARPDSWHLCVTNSRPLASPVPARGRLGLWTPTPEQVAAIEKQLRTCAGT